MLMAPMLYQWLMVAFLFATGETPSVKEPVATAPVTASVFHPFYVSVTELAHNQAEKTLEISCKVFAEDLEAIIKKNYKAVVSLNEDKDKASLNRLIPDYFNRHLQIVVDGKPVVLSFLGFEKDKESAYCYFQVEGVSAARKINIQNSILHDFIDQQINIMHVSIGGKRQSSKLNFPEKAAAFNF